VKIAITRSGGFAGLVQRAVIDTSEMADAEDWHALAGRVDLAALPPPRPQPDRYIYEIEIDGKAAEVGEADLTGPLRELVDKVMAAAR
jgi:hypothetical protein